MTEMTIRKGIIKEEICFDTNIFKKKEMSPHCIALEDSGKI